ncbi:MAG: serine/threonine-protein kinase [Ignavibacteriaceae bacterium]
MIGETILHYKVLEKLGEGGMGVVYKAHDNILNRDVAIKFLPKQLSSKEEKERFTVEARAAAVLNHPNIATIYAIEQADKQAFIVMEFIDGVELKEKISKGILKTNEALDIIKQVAEGLETAHEKGVIHRDIKSTNIMVTANSRIKIMDFGLAKIKGSDFVTRIGTTMGTVAYMSPEQAQGGSSDHRSDLWSMGVILYEMLAGKLPYTGEFEQAIIYSV